MSLLKGTHESPCDLVKVGVPNTVGLGEGLRLRIFKWLPR